MNNSETTHKFTIGVMAAFAVAALAVMMIAVPLMNPSSANSTAATPGWLFKAAFIATCVGTALFAFLGYACDKGNLPQAGEGWKTLVKVGFGAIVGLIGGHAV